MPPNPPPLPPVDSGVDDSGSGVATGSTATGAGATAGFGLRGGAFFCAFFGAAFFGAAFLGAAFLGAVFFLGAAFRFAAERLTLPAFFFFNATFDLPTFFFTLVLLLPAVRFFFIATLQFDRPNPRHPGKGSTLILQAPQRREARARRYRKASPINSQALL